jgi:hypothetical protein
LPDSDISAIKPKDKDGKISRTTVYIPQRYMVKAAFKQNGSMHEVKKSAIMDGIYVKKEFFKGSIPSLKALKVTRTQFEEEDFEFAKGGEIDNAVENFKNNNPVFSEMLYKPINDSKDFGEKFLKMTSDLTGKDWICRSLEHTQNRNSFKAINKKTGVVVWVYLSTIGYSKYKLQIWEKNFPNSDKLLFEEYYPQDDVKEGEYIAKVGARHADSMVNSSIQAFYNIVSSTNFFKPRKTNRLTPKNDNYEFGQGGTIEKKITSINEITDIEKLVKEGKVTYKGLGIGKKAKEFSSMSNGETVFQITVGKAKYYIVGSDLKKLRDMGDVNFKAAHRQFN